MVSRAIGFKLITDHLRYSNIYRIRPETMREAYVAQSKLILSLQAITNDFISKILKHTSH